jgi:hypothetical protein
MAKKQLLTYREWQQRTKARREATAARRQQAQAAKREAWWATPAPANYGVNRTKVHKVSQDFSIICHINMLGAWQILGFVAVPSTFGGHLFFATHCQT